MKINERSVKDRLCKAWDNSFTEMRKLGHYINANPKSGREIFLNDEKCKLDAINFKTVPVILELPERLNRKSSNILVVLTGKLSFNKSTTKNQLITEKYSTSTEYFRKKEGNLIFLGALHHDYDEEEQISHPRFHSQFSNRIMRFKDSYLFKEYPKPEECKAFNFLANTRIPTLQLDFFSSLLNLCADHLINDKDSRPEIFEKIYKNCNFFQSASPPHRIVENSPCIRSIHLYPKIS